MKNDYFCDGQMSLFDIGTTPLRVTKPIRLIELFAGVGSQAMAMRDIGANFTHHRVVEFDRFAIASYNAIHGTDFPTMDICDIHGSDLGIEDVEDYTYICFYSFPCTDLSVAGKMQGMSKGSGTRSGLLWEVERLLLECEHKPQILIMENVPQVHSKPNMADFQDWIDSLKRMGYTSKYADLNAKDFGVAQNRNRTFMVSWLGDHSYEFPKPIPLTKVMADYLEDEVDEKYYVNSERAENLINKLIEEGKIPEDGKKKTAQISHNGKQFDKYIDSAVTITATDNKGWRGYGTNGVIEA